VVLSKREVPKITLSNLGIVFQSIHANLGRPDSKTMRPTSRTTRPTSKNTRRNSRRQSMFVKDKKDEKKSRKKFGQCVNTLGA
jgi:hypothetical protein